MSGQESSSATGTSVSNGAVTKKPCRYVRAAAVCPFGRRCKFAHDARPTAPHVVARPQQFVGADEQHAETRMQLRRTELTALGRRFPSSRRESTGDAADAVSLTFSPTDPDWPFDVKSVDLRLLFPARYPVDPVKVRAVGPPLLPRLLLDCINNRISEWLKDQQDTAVASDRFALVLRRFWIWLDRSLENVFCEGLRRAKLDVEAAAAGISLVDLNAIRLSSAADAAGQSNDESAQEQFAQEPSLLESCSDSEPATSSSECKNGTQPQSDSKRSVTNGQSGERPANFEMRMQAGQLGANVATVSPASVVLLLQCDRCSMRFEVVAANGRASPSLACTRCHFGQAVHMRAALLHQHSNVAAQLRLDGCAAVDLIVLPSVFAVVCLNCNEEASVTGLSYGATQKTWCRRCNGALELRVDAVRFHRLRPVESAASATAAQRTAPTKDRRPAEKGDPRVKEGAPLPANGTCKHYRKSYRWFRFPCCGKLYACDVCHEENETHEMKFANRIVCGFCAKEQPYQSTKPCAGCGGHVVKLKSAHWEGGQGCRDSLTMARGERQKYRNMNKTVPVKQLQKKEAKTKQK